ncbi:DUF3147 family protein [Geobacter sp. SVR]|uniref:DUF3147 family protein n=1 Tax=Geobacter sp. SVR TaxID=2495594 RepID=UPI0015672A24|nr:DUF3147 family protein [Geobacter sp. SVR]
MHILLKTIISMAIIFSATAIGKRLLATAGLIGVMPLAGALVLVWLRLESKGDAAIVQEFTRSALWGIVLSILFYLVAFVCFKKHLPLPVVLVSSFGAWSGAAFVHQWLLK